MYSLYTTAFVTVVKAHHLIIHNMMLSLPSSARGHMTWELITLMVVDIHMFGDWDLLTHWSIGLFNKKIRVTGPLWGESTGHRWFPLTKASDAGLWCFLWSPPEQAVKQTIETPVIWDAIALILTTVMTCLELSSSVSDYKQRWILSVIFFSSCHYSGVIRSATVSRMFAQPFFFRRRSKKTS